VESLVEIKEHWKNKMVPSKMLKLKAFTMNICLISLSEKFIFLSLVVPGRWKAKNRIKTIKAEVSIYLGRKLFGVVC
jgi:hypothetical protein